MAIFIKTTDPQALLAAIYKAIDNDKIVTWAYDKEGDFTHMTDQWKNLAWLHPVVLPGELRLGIVKAKDTKMTNVVFGVYHGRFIEMVVTQFDDLCTSATSTSQITEFDTV
ncbi:MAG: hypothetical protein ABI415_05930 [Flavitalea sp.]